MKITWSQIASIKKLNDFIISGVTAGCDTQKNRTKSLKFNLEINANCS